AIWPAPHVGLGVEDQPCRLSGELLEREALRLTMDRPAAMHGDDVVRGRPERARLRQPSPRHTHGRPPSKINRRFLPRVSRSRGAGFKHPSDLVEVGSDYEDLGEAVSI